MPARDSRYTQVGSNSGGDAMFRRTYPNRETAVMEAEGGYEDMTKAELEELLEERGLPKSGNKDELIARLQENA